MDQSRWWKAQHRESNQWIIIALFGDTWCCTWGEHNITYRVVHSIVHLKLMSRGESVILQWKNGDYKRTQAPMPFPSVSPDPFFRLTIPVQISASPQHELPGLWKAPTPMWRKRDQKDKNTLLAFIPRKMWGYNWDFLQGSSCREHGAY